MRRVVLIAALVLALPVVAAAGIEGTYDCKGSNPAGGGSYQGSVSIVKNAENYTVTWTIGSQIYVGVGILDNDQFSVGYADLSKGWFGVVVYKVSGNTMTGPWAMHGGGQNGTETLTKK